VKTRGDMVGSSWRLRAVGMCFFGEDWDRLEWNYGGCSGCCGCVFGQNWKVQM
jgi:hypothetical protein